MIDGIVKLLQSVRSFGRKLENLSLRMKQGRHSNGFGVLLGVNKLAPVYIRNEYKRKN